MNEDLREKVLLTVNNIGETTLTFQRNKDWDFKTESLDLSDLIRLLFRTGAESATVEVDNPETKQCRYGASRSATDIWRLCKKSRPDITIFEVMQTLHKMNIEGTISTWYCCTVTRRVFNNFGGSIYRYNHDHTDEFGMTFDDWKEI